MDNDGGSSAFVAYLPDICTVFRLREFQRNSFADYRDCILF
jgi:hypothetical protein